jgi:hypothetical protein
MYLFYGGALVKPLDDPTSLNDHVGEDAIKTGSHFIVDKQNLRKCQRPKE